MDFNSIITYLACIVFIFIFGRIFIVPLKSIFKVILNSVFGAILLFFINVIGGSFGFHIGINVLTALCVGLLGIPGAGLLMVLRIILRLLILLNF